MHHSFHLFLVLSVICTTAPPTFSMDKAPEEEKSQVQPQPSENKKGYDKNKVYNITLTYFKTPPKEPETFQTFGEPEKFYVTTEINGKNLKKLDIAEARQAFEHPYPINITDTFEKKTVPNLKTESLKVIWTDIRTDPQGNPIIYKGGAKFWMDRKHQKDTVNLLLKEKPFENPIDSPIPSKISAQEAKKRLKKFSHSSELYETVGYNADFERDPHKRNSYKIKMQFDSLEKVILGLSKGASLEPKKMVVLKYTLAPDPFDIADKNKFRLDFAPQTPRINVSGCIINGTPLDKITLEKALRIIQGGYIEFIPVLSKNPDISEGLQHSIDEVKITYYPDFNNKNDKDIRRYTLHKSIHKKTKEFAFAPDEPPGKNEPSFTQMLDKLRKKNFACTSCKVPSLAIDENLDYLYLGINWKFENPSKKSECLDFSIHVPSNKEFQKGDISEIYTSEEDITKVGT